MAHDPKTAARVRRLLARRRGVVEKTIVGGSLGFMVAGKLCCSVGENRILIRVNPETRNKMLSKPHTRPMKMMGRTVTGFMFVDPTGYRSDKSLKAWIDSSLAVIASLPAAKKRPARRKKTK